LFADDEGSLHLVIPADAMILRYAQDDSEWAQKDPAKGSFGNPLRHRLGEV
jgi:hypothetical protein